MSTYKCGPDFGQRGARAYALRLEGLSWTEIALILEPPSVSVSGGDPESAMTNLAKKYAKTRGLAWPVHVSKPEVPEVVEEPDPCHEKQGKAYTMRLSGLTWKEIASLVGYKYTPHAVGAARKHAIRGGLSWPIVVAS